MNIFIAIPSFDTVHTDFAISLAKIVASSPLPVILGNVRTPKIHQSREELAEMAIRAKADWCLWLDSDMSLPHTLISDMLKHNKDIVAGKYKRQGGSYCINYDDDNRPITVGFGCFLIRTEVLASISQPRFASPWDSQNKMYMSEDFYFCLKLREVGHTLTIAEELTPQIKHLKTIGL